MTMVTGHTTQNVAVRHIYECTFCDKVGPGNVMLQNQGKRGNTRCVSCGKECKNITFTDKGLFVASML